MSLMVRMRISLGQRQGIRQEVGTAIRKSGGNLRRSEPAPRNGQEEILLVELQEPDTVGNVVHAIESVPGAAICRVELAGHERKAPPR